MSNIKKKLLSIDRRNFLKGLYGLSLSLPVMDFMLNSSGMAYAQSNRPLDKTFLTFYNGIACPLDFMVKNNPGQLNAGNSNAVLNKFFTNSKYSGYASVLNKMTVVSNMYIPDGKNGTRSLQAPGIASTELLHGDAQIVQFTGTNNSFPNAPKLEGTNDSRQKDSLDVLIARQFDLPINKVVHFSVQGKNRYPDQPEYAIRNIQYNRNNVGGPENHIKFATVPERNFAALLNTIVTKDSAGTPNASGVNPVQMANLLKKNVVDFISKSRVSYLKSILPRSGQTKLEQQLDLLRDTSRLIQTELQQSGNIDVSSLPPNCKGFNAPVDFNNSHKKEYYHDELNRAGKLIVILRLAAVCNDHRVGLIPITMSECNLRPVEIVKKYKGSPPENQNVDYHHYSHEKKTADHQAMVEWHYDIMLRLAKEYESIQVGNGNFLDHALLSVSNEGGWDESYGNQFPHAGNNIFASYVTGMNNLKKGQHIRTNRSHLAEFHLSLMRSVGYRGNLGRINNTIGELSA